MKNKLIILFITILFPFSVFSQEKNGKWEELFFKANQQYNNNNFEKALNTYLEIEKSNHVTGDHYFNMGNTCFRLNMIGHAILYYERAFTFIPRDEDLDYNLRFVRKKTKDAITESTDIISSAFFWTDSMTTNEAFWIFALFNLIFWGIMLLRLYVKKEWTYYAVIIFFTAWIITGVSFGWKYYLTATDDRAVALSKQVDVLSGPDTGDTLLFRLHAGAIVTQERAEDGWKLISLPDKKRGWVEKIHLEKISKKVN